MPDNPHDRLNMDHLRQEVAEAQANAREAEPQAPSAKDAADPASDPRLEPEYSFRFNWKDGRGKVWQGNFSNRILSIAQRMQVGVVRARRQVGVPLTSLSQQTVELIYMISWLEESLTQRPDWARDLNQLTSEELVQAIFLRVAEHERRFHGLREPEAEGASA